MGALVRRRFLAGVGVSAVLALAGCKVVSIADQKTSGTDTFDAKRFAEGIWETRVLPHFAKEAKALVEVISAVGANLDTAGARLGYRAAAEGAPWNFIVSGKGIVKEKNTKSRAGTLSVELTNGRIVTLQIGPVVKGNSVRDSLPFVSFKEFTNQLEFADVGKALNTLALRAVEAAVPNIEVGDSVTFVGTFSLSSPAEEILIMPVSVSTAA